MNAMPFAMSRDLNCSGCGYGIVARAGLPERCPMCGGSGWAAHRLDGSSYPYRVYESSPMPAIRGRRETDIQDTWRAP